MAFWQGKKAPEYKTHKWTVYVRSATDECDIAPVISKVVFNLHPSFQDHVRTVEAPPFEVSETGWGEFELTIQIHFTQDSGEDPVELIHQLKFYEDENNTLQKKPVGRRNYYVRVFASASPGYFFAFFVVVVLSFVDPPTFHARGAGGV